MPRAMKSPYCLVVEAEGVGAGIGAADYTNGAGFGEEISNGRGEVFLRPQADGLAGRWRPPRPRARDWPALMSGRTK